ncbi:MAG TPA: alpha/beta fold hydrolase [Dehalococcoidia bacterium]|nr:alpha/beta fold hydrolase [Dehalococcoidia bacterium]
MSTYVLIHGAWHGAWCWYKVIPLLEKEGHTVHALDMPGFGRDKTPMSEITSGSIVQHVCGILDYQDEPVILVGHSWGGTIITQVAESRPKKIKLLVYLTAFLLTSGEALPQQFWQSKLSQTINLSEDKSYSTINVDGVKEACYHDCSEEDVTLAKLLLVPHPTGTFAPVVTTEENFDKVPRVYIECLQDNAIMPSLQKWMYTHVPCEKVISMNTSHSPFFSAPEELAAHLSSLG